MLDMELLSLGFAAVAEALKCTLYTHFSFTECYSAIAPQEMRSNFFGEHVTVKKKNIKCLYFDTEG